MAAFSLPHAGGVTPARKEKMKKIVVLRGTVNWKAASDIEIAAHLKADGNDKYSAWNNYIRLRDLKPRINAKDFYKIFEGVAPASIYPRYEEQIEMTHFDNLKNCCVQIKKNEDTGVFKMIWDDGSTGGYPPIYPPEAERYIPLDQYHG
jgi:hypothetical protein